MTRASFSLLFIRRAHWFASTSRGGTLHARKLRGRVSQRRTKIRLGVRVPDDGSLTFSAFTLIEMPTGSCQNIAFHPAKTMRSPTKIPGRGTSLSTIMREERHCCRGKNRVSLSRTSPVTFYEKGLAWNAEYQTMKRCTMQSIVQTSCN